MTLIFDTETTGFVNKNLPLFHPDQPHIVQLGCMLIDDSGAEHGLFKSLIYPEGYDEMPAGAFAAHGISIDQCKQFGIPIISALSVFINWSKLVTRVVAHNIAYDMSVLKCELARLKKAITFEAEHCSFCTMEAMTPICRLPSRRPGGGHKWPKLEECIQHLFQEELSGAHDAMVDVQATKRVFLWLKAQGLVK